MTLQDYLIQHELTYTAFALKIGSRHARTVERYAKGQQTPDKTMMLRIIEATESQVTPNDFFGLSAEISTAPANSPSSGNAAQVSPSGVERAA